MIEIVIIITSAIVSLSAIVMTIDDLRTNRQMRKWHRDKKED